jgi:hypothetical protein
VLILPNIDLFFPNLYKKRLVIAKEGWIIFCSQIFNVSKSEVNSSWFLGWLLVLGLQTDSDYEGRKNSDFSTRVAYRIFLVNG